MKTKRNYAIILLLVLAACTNSSKLDETPTATASPVSDSTTSQVTGIDISQWQGDELSKSNAINGLSFVICRSSYGVEPDPDFSSNWSILQKTKVVGGMYHYYYGNLPVQEQINTFVQALQQLADTDLPPIVDIEDTSFYNHCTEVVQIQNLSTFIQAVQKQTGRTPLLYMNVSCGSECLSIKPFIDYPLYIACYDTKIQQPTLPTGWQNTSWVFWQKSNSYTIDGIQNDYDVFNGNQKELITFIKNSKK